jgi:hypothetical protein
MENEININTPAESVIAAYGTSSSHRLMPLFIGIGALLLSLLLGWGFFWILAGPLRLPAQTAFLGIASPRTLQDQLSPERRSSLPEAWRLQTEHASRWPILFGAYREEDAWQFFVIGPRWSLADRDGLLIEKSRATALITNRLSASTTETTTYFSWWWKTIRRPYAFAQLEIHPHVLSSSFFPPTETIEGILYRDRLMTNLAPSAVTAMADSPPGDVFLRFNPATTGTARTALLQSLDLNDDRFSLANLSPQSLNLRYNASGTISRIQFTIPEAMSSSTKRSLLAALGFSKKVILSLPDGSLLAERQLPSEQELRITSSYKTPAGSLELTDTSFDLQKEATSTEERVSLCQTGTLVGRFSPRVIQQLLNALDLPFLSSEKGIQILQDQTRVYVCLEASS